MNTQPTDDESQIRAAFENHWRSFGWSEGRLARWQVDDESLPPAVRGAYMIGSVQQMWQSWCAGAKWGTPATGGEPAGWLYDWISDEGELVRDWFTTDYDEAHSEANQAHNIRALDYRGTSPQPVREPLNTVELMRVVMKADEESQATRGTTNWAAHVGKAVQNAVLGITGGQHGTE